MNPLTVSSTAKHPAEFVLVAVSDPVLHPEAVHVAATSGLAVVDTVDPRDVHRLFLKARWVLVDNQLAEYVSQLPRRHGVFYIEPEPGPVDWRAAMVCHAESAHLLPAQAHDLLQAFGHCDGPTRDTRAVIVGVMGACGGAGTSTFAAALARELARSLGEVTLVDAVPYSGGLDLLLGIEQYQGVRWGDLLGLEAGAQEERTVESESSGEDKSRHGPTLGQDTWGGDLRGALPRTDDGIALLSHARSAVMLPGALAQPTRSSTELVLSELSSSSAAVIVDCAPGQLLNQSFDPSLLDAVIILIPAQVRPAAQAAQMAAQCRHLRLSASALLCHRGWSGLSAAEMEEITGLEIIGEIRQERGLAKAGECGGMPHRLPHSLSRCARAVLVQTGLTQQSIVTAGKKQNSRALLPGPRPRTTAKQVQ